MKYEKRTNRMIAMALAASMVTTMVPVTAFAEGEGEGGSTTTTTSNPDGSTTTTTTNSDGSSTSTTTSTSGEGTKAEPTVKVEVTVTVDANGDKTAVGDKTTTSYSDTDSFGNKTDSTTTTENWATGADVPTPPVEDNRTDEQKTQDFVDSFKDGSSETTNTTGTTGTETTSKTDVHNIYGEHTKDAGSVEGSETKTDTETTVEQKLDSEKYKDENVTGEYEIVGADKDGKPTPEDVVEDLGDFEKTDGSEGNPLPSTDPMMPDADMDLKNENTDLSATVIPADKTVGTDEKTWKDWKNAYDKMVSDAETKVKTAAAAEAGVDVGAGVYDADKGTTTYTKVTANDETGEKVEKVVVVKKNVDAKTGDITFTMETTIITTPADSAAVKNEALSGITDPESVYSYGYENNGVIDFGEEVVKTNVHLPAKPEPTDVTDEETGRRRVTTVEDIVDENNPDQVIGYKVISTIYDRNGEVVGGGEEKMMGEVTTTTTTTEVKKTTTIDIYTQETVVTEKTITKDVTTKTVVIDMEDAARQLTLKWLGATAGGSGDDIDGAILDWETLQTDVDAFNWMKVTGEGLHVDQDIDDATAAQIQYIQHALWSYLSINKAAGGTTNGYIYQLKDDDPTTDDFYGYCIDYATNAQRGYFYEIENLEDQNYFKNNEDKEAYKQIAAIALNGFWGTTSGTGSMSSVRGVLENYLKTKGGKTASEAKTIADSLTAREALSATQAAFWKYGNSGNTGVNVNNVSPNENVKLLFAALTDTSLQSTSQNNATDILDEKDITSATVVVKDKVAASADGKTDTFKTDVSFSLAVVPTGEGFAVAVYNGDSTTPVTTKLLSELNKTGDTYTIEGIQLQENVNISLNITGTQVLDRGVYLYTSEKISGVPSQSFVSVAEGKRQVNLDVNLTFDVKDPDISESGEYDTWNGEKTQRTTSKINRHKQDKVVTAMMEITTETVTTTEHEWQESYEETWSPNHNGGGELGGDELEETEPTTPDPTPEKPTPEDPGKVAGDEEELQDIGDEEAPLDDLLLGDEEIVAATGDSNNMTAAAGGMFAALAGMLFLRKKKEN